MNNHNRPNEYEHRFPNGWRHGYASALRDAISVLEPCDDRGHIHECLHLLKAQMLTIPAAASGAPAGCP